MNFNEVSVIICTHNGSKRINAILDALIQQELSKDMSVEVVVLDNASTDSTAESVHHFWQKQHTNISLRILTEPKAGKANALIKAYNEARYELMLLCDDDNLLQPAYIKTVLEIYNQHPDIGLLGGYGKAFFDKEDKPEWFDKWENLYVCGKHHTQNGFLKSKDFSIWGAGSVIRKTMWNYLTANGFKFFNSTKKGKAMSEDAELSMMITFTGHRLYFDERLWFIHDLSGGRICWENMIEQQKLNGKTNAVLYMYQLAYEQTNDSFTNLNFHFLKKLSGISWHLFKSFLKPNNRPRWIFFYYILKELIFNSTKYKKIAIQTLVVTAKITNSFPLKN